MILPVVFATYNRFPLLRQTVETLIKNTDSELEIVILDASDNWEGIEHYLKRKKTKVIYKHLEKRVPIYEAKNLGVSLASPSEYIHIADDDIYYEPHWDTRLMEVLHYFPDIGVVGGKKHPHHQTLKTIEFRGYKILVVNNQPGYSFFVRRGDLSIIGSFRYLDDKLCGEDSAFCEDVRKVGMKVAAVEPPVLYHCGFMNFRKLKASDYLEMIEISEKRPDILFK